MTKWSLLALRGADTLNTMCHWHYGCNAVKKANVEKLATFCRLQRIRYDDLHRKALKCNQWNCNARAWSWKPEWFILTTKWKWTKNSTTVLGLPAFILRYCIVMSGLWLLVSCNKQRTAVAARWKMSHAKRSPKALIEHRDRFIGLF